VWDLTTAVTPLVLNRRKENKQSTDAGRWLRRHLPTNVPATEHLIDLDHIQPVLV
jgi:hypothetical protein